MRLFLPLKFEYFIIEKLNLQKISHTALKVEASAAVASAGIANGRNVPVVFVKSDENNRINNIISMHKTIKEGNCECSWGVTNDNKNAVLILDFKNPIEQKIVLLFDIIKSRILCPIHLFDHFLHIKFLFYALFSRHSLCFSQIKRPQDFLNLKVFFVFTQY